MAYSVSSKTINNWTVYGQNHYLELINEQNLSVQSSTGNYYEQQIVKSVPVLIAVFSDHREIRLYSHHLNYEMFLIRNKLTNKQLELHCSRILSISKNKMATEIQKYEKS